MKKNRFILVFLLLLVTFSVMPSMVYAGNPGSQQQTTDAHTGSKSSYGGDVFAIGVCDDPGVKESLRIIGTVMKWIEFVVPVFLVITGVVALAKAVLSQDDKLMHTAVSSMLTKLAIGVAIFFLPTVIFSIVKLVGNEGSKAYNCIKCIDEPTSCK